MKKIKRVIGLFMLCSVLFSASNLNVFASELTTTTQTVVKQKDEMSIQKVDTSGTISLGSYGYFEDSFTMKGFLGIGTVHNAFSVKISNITSGSCTVTISGSNGYSWTSSTITSGSTITTTNASSTATYTVTVMAGSAGCIGSYSFTSYIQ